MGRARLYSTLRLAARSARRGSGAPAKPGHALSIPNLITLGRIILVPMVVWAISSGAMWLAFVLFLVADDAGFVTGSTLSINGGQHMY